MNTRIQEIVENYAVNHQFSGVVRIKKHELTIYEGAFGYASKPFRIPNKMEYRFATASVTKMFTALAVLKLADEKRLGLDDLLSKYVAYEGSTLQEGITLKHLLTHTSGIADYYDAKDPDGYQKLWRVVPSQYVDSLTKLLPLFIDEPAESRPGEKFSYSGAGYILLGLVIEKVSGMPYFDYMRDHIFKAHYLYETDFIPLHLVTDHVAEGYIPIKDQRNHLQGWERNIFSVPAYGLSDRGLFSSAKDMIKFLGMIKRCEVLSEAMTAEWLKAHIQVEQDLSYGYGMWLVNAPDGSLLKYGHTGEAPGVSARVFHYPKQNIDLVLFSNHGLSTSALLKELEDVFMSGQYND